MVGKCMKGVESGGAGTDTGTVENMSDVYSVSATCMARANGQCQK